MLFDNSQDPEEIRKHHILSARHSAIDRALDEVLTPLRIKPNNAPPELVDAIHALTEIHFVAIARKLSDTFIFPFDPDTLTATVELNLVETQLDSAYPDQTYRHHWDGLITLFNHADRMLGQDIPNFDAAKTAIGILRET